MSEQQLTSEAIQSVAALAKATMRTEFVKRPGDPPHVVYMVKPDGSAEEMIVEPPPLNCVLATPEAFVEYCNSMCPAAPAKGSEIGPAVFYDPSRIVLVEVLAERRDKATCNLEKSEQFAWLEEAHSRQFKQAEFIRVLRITLAGALPGDSGLLALVRNLKWSTTATATGVIQQGRESMGKMIDSQVNGESAIPEEITLTVPVFKNYSFEASIRCAIDVAPQEQMFRLTPFPNQLDYARQGAMAAIRLTLSQQKAPVFFGSP